jgi:hypothetical protein
VVQPPPFISVTSKINKTGGNNRNVKSMNIINKCDGELEDSDLRKSFSKTREKGMASSNRRINTKWRISRQSQARRDLPRIEQISGEPRRDVVQGINVAREEREKCAVSERIEIKKKLQALDSSDSVETMLPCLVLLSSLTIKAHP